jgi:hypothetical protein
VWVLIGVSCQPSGSIALPTPARSCVLVLIVSSFAVRSVSRRDPSRSLPPREVAWWWSSRFLLRQPVPLPPPLGSIAQPPARSRVVVVIVSSRVTGVMVSRRSVRPAEGRRLSPALILFDPASALEVRSM